jgi:hypothetical protein
MSKKKPHTTPEADLSTTTPAEQLRLHLAAGDMSAAATIAASLDIDREWTKTVLKTLVDEVAELETAIVDDERPLLRKQEEVRVEAVRISQCRPFDQAEVDRVEAEKHKLHDEFRELGRRLSDSLAAEIRAGGLKSWAPAMFGWDGDPGPLTAQTQTYQAVREFLGLEPGEPICVDWRGPIARPTIVQNIRRLFAPANG